MLEQIKYIKNWVKQYQQEIVKVYPKESVIFKWVNLVNSWCFPFIYLFIKKQCFINIKYVYKFIGDERVKSLHSFLTIKGFPKADEKSQLQMFIPGVFIRRLDQNLVAVFPYQLEKIQKIENVVFLQPLKALNLYNILRENFNYVVESTASNNMPYFVVYLPNVIPYDPDNNIKPEEQAIQDFISQLRS
jgi:hypothetical protein